MLFLAILVAAAQPQQLEAEPDFIVQVGTSRHIPIYCDNNRANIELSNKQEELLIKSLHPLILARASGTLTEEQNENLLEGEVLVSVLQRTQAALSWAQYYCDHPEKLPPEQDFTI